MERYKVTVSATLVFEVDATTWLDARTAIVTHFHKHNSFDPLAGTRFKLKTGWKFAANPRLMTTSCDDTSATVEPV